MKKVKKKIVNQVEFVFLMLGHFLGLHENI